MYSCTISQVGGHQRRKNKWDISKGIQFQWPLGARGRQGGIALNMWEREWGMRLAYHLPVYVLPLSRTLRKSIEHLQEHHYSQGLYRNYYGGKWLSLGELLLFIHWAWLTENLHKEYYQLSQSFLIPFGH